MKKEDQICRTVAEAVAERRSKNEEEDKKRGVKEDIYLRVKLLKGNKYDGTEET